MIELPFAPACERNKVPILNRLVGLLPDQGRVLEIGSGTGQHAVFFASRFPSLTWQTSERESELAGLSARVEREGPDDMPPPIALDVSQGPWPHDSFDVVFTANTAHIMPWASVCAMISGVGRLLARGGCFCLYGPFMQDGEHTAPSNAVFDRGLRERDPLMGVRDRVEVDAVALREGLRPDQRLLMPANNFLLVYRR